MGADDDRWTVDPDIARACTPPARIYSDAAVFEALREKVFARSWQLVGDEDQIQGPASVCPAWILDGLIDEPILLTRDDQGRIHTLSNVCTHRGNLLCSEPAVERSLRCRYHGRRFHLDGRFHSMPEFEGVHGFPSERDDLPRVPSASWGKFLFSSVDPAIPFDALIAEMRERLAGVPIAQAVLDPARSKDYLVQANWALYCDNYLEGFHIPHVHGSLTEVLDYGLYRTELFAHSVLQVGLAKRHEDALDLPPTSPDQGQHVAGYYFWLFPNTMFNVYPWGISVNIVTPLSVDQTRVRYRTYVWDAKRLDCGAGSGLDRVEREDERIVESEQKGIRARLYRGGRYSVKRETGVHHFHRLLAAALT